MKKKLFFVTYGGGHARLVAEVANHLAKKNEYQICILGLTTAHKYLTKVLRNVEIKSLIDYKPLFKLINNEVDTFGRSLLHENFNTNSGISKNESIYYLGLSFWDLKARIGEIKAKKKYSKHKRNAFEPIEVIERIMLYENPDLVISTTSPRFEIAAIRAAKKNKIPTLQLMDLFAEIYPQPEAKFIGCTNQKSKEILEKKLKKSSKVFVVGQPSIEKTMMNVASKNIQDIKKCIDIPMRSKVILVATQKMITKNSDRSTNDILDNKDIFDNIFKQLSQIENFNKFKILVRFHPISEDSQTYLKLKKKYPFLYITNDEISLSDSIAISNLVITHSSTVGIEALMCNKKVITFTHDYENTHPVTEYTESPFIHVHDSEITNAINNLERSSSNQNHKEFIPLGSVEKIYKLIGNILC